MMRLRLSEQENQVLKCPECQTNIFTATSKTGCEHVQYIKEDGGDFVFGDLSDGDRERLENAYYYSMEAWIERTGNHDVSDYFDWVESNGGVDCFSCGEDDEEKSYFTIIDLEGERWELCFTPESKVNSDFEVDSEW